MEKEKYGVHRTHCCIEHGCKYGDKDCPVVNREIRQDYICEDCDNEGINSVDELFLSPWKKELKKVNQCPQRQDSLQDQLRDLAIIANKFGLYDANDYLKTVLEIY